MNCIEYDIESLKQNISHAEMRKEFYSESVGDFELHGLIQGFLVTQSGVCNAGAALFNSNHLVEGKSVVFVSYFEAIDKESGTELMRAIIEYARFHLKGSIMIGPVNISTWHTYRLALDHFESQFPGDVASQSFYVNLFEEAGFTVYKSYQSNLQNEILIDKFKLNTNVKIVYLNEAEIISNLGQIYEISMDAFKNAALFQAISESAFIEKYKKDLSRLNPQLMPFVCDTNGHLLAFLLSYQGYEADTLVIKTMARRSGRAYAGLGQILSNEINLKAKEMGYKRMIHAFMQTDNVSRVLSQNNKANVLKKYALYQYNLI